MKRLLLLLIAALALWWIGRWLNDTLDDLANS